MEPVYLHSVTVGSLRHTGHLGRVLNQRQERLGPLPASYRRNQPLLSGKNKNKKKHMRIYKGLIFMSEGITIQSVR